ncbi:hypothetical protein BC835DRAFT_1424750 [Cytidiella melzeri]|nr:hypothetical protein BC835DRAFT_1424750 [Cytidiella melzeri]
MPCKSADEDSLNQLTITEYVVLQTSLAFVSASNVILVRLTHLQDEMQKRLDAILRSATSFYSNGNRQTPSQKSKKSRERHVVYKVLMDEREKLYKKWADIDVSASEIQEWELQNVALTVACAILNPCEHFNSPFYLPGFGYFLQNILPSIT